MKKLEMLESLECYLRHLEFFGGFKIPKIPLDGGVRR